MPIDRPISSGSATSTALKALTLCGASILAGIGFGVLASAGLGMFFMYDVAAIFGGAVGLLTSPFLAFALWRKRRRARGAAIIILSTALVAFVGAFFTPPNAGPWLSMGLSATAYVTACLWFGAWAVAHEIEDVTGPFIPRCPSCGYSLEGLPEGCLCPECGATPAASFPKD